MYITRFSGNSFGGMSSDIHLAASFVYYSVFILHSYVFNFSCKWAIFSTCVSSVVFLACKTLLLWLVRVRILCQQQKTSGYFLLSNNERKENPMF